MIFLEINKAKYLEDYKIKLWFNNGNIGVVDLSDHLNGSIFEPLKDNSLFQKFHVKYGTVRWENGADFAPEFLYKACKILEDFKVSDSDTEYFTRSPEQP